MNRPRKSSVVKTESPSVTTPSASAIPGIAAAFSIREMSPRPQRWRSVTSARRTGCAFPDHVRKPNVLLRSSAFPIVSTRYSYSARGP